MFNLTMLFGNAGLTRLNILNKHWLDLRILRGYLVCVSRYSENTMIYNI